MAKKKQRPKIPVAPFSLRKLFLPPFGLDVMAAAFVALGGTANAIRAFNSDEFLPCALWATTAGGLLTMSCAKVWVQATEPPSVAREIFGCLHVLHAQLTERQSTNLRVRITLYVPDQTRTQLVQATEYVGTTTGEVNYGRSLPVSMGLIGLAYRSGRAQVVAHLGGTREDLVRNLIDQLGYTKEDARQVDPDSNCWFASPIVVDNLVEGVIFADCTDSTFFVPDLNPHGARRQRIINDGTVGVASFLSHRQS